MNYVTRLVTSSVIRLYREEYPVQAYGTCAWEIDNVCTNISKGKGKVGYIANLSTNISNPRLKTKAQ